MRRYVLAGDPGKMTGLAFYDNATGFFQSDEFEFVDSCEMIRKTSEVYATDLDVVFETFLITTQTGKNTQATWSLEMIGVARYFSLVNTDQELIMQLQAEAKTFAYTDRLKAFGWYLPGKPNANDGSRHLMRYLAKHGWWDDRLGPKDE